MNYYIFVDPEVIIAIKAEEVIDEYEQIEIINMSKNLLYNTQMDKIFFNNEKELLKLFILEKTSRESTLYDADNWHEAVGIWTVSMEEEGIDKHSILKKVLK